MEENKSDKIESFSVLKDTTIQPARNKVLRPISEEETKIMKEIVYWSPNMDVKILEKMILDFIKSNNGSCNLNALFIHLFPFMKDEPEPTVLTMPIVTGLITNEKIRVNNLGMFEIIEEQPLQQRKNNVELIIEILDYIKQNQGTQNLTSLYAHFYSLFENKKDSQNFIENTVRDLITKGIIKINENDRFEMREFTYKEDLKKSIINRIRHTPMCYTSGEMINLYLPLLDSTKDGTSIIMNAISELINEGVVKVNEIGRLDLVIPKTKQTPENKTMNTETKQPVFTVSDEQSKTLLLIKEHFKVYFGINLTFEQTIDRAFRIVQEQIEPGRYCSVQQPINTIPFNPPNFNNWVRPPGWDVGVAKSGNNFNAPQHFNQMPFPGYLRYNFCPKGTDMNPYDSQGNAKEMRYGLKKVGLPNQDLDFNSLLRGKPSQVPPNCPNMSDPAISNEVGPYAYLYPGFVNILLPQRDYGSRKDVRDIANCINTMTSPIPVVSKPKKKRSYKIKSPKK